MKKIISIVIISIISQLFCTVFADDTKVINLHTNGAYILDLKYRPLEMNVSNKNVINAEVATELYSPQSQLVIRTYDEGISYITYKIKNQKAVIKVLVDNNAPVDNEVVEIDKVKEPQIK